MSQKMSKGTIARWVFAALFLVTGLGYITQGFRGVIGCMIMICAAFLMSPLSTQIDAFGKKSAIAVGASIVSVFIAAAVLPSEDKPQHSSEQPTRTVIAEHSENDTTMPETTTTTAETTVFTDTTATTEITTGFEIDLRGADITTDGETGGRGIPTESGSSSSATKTTTTTTKTTTASTSTTQSTTAAAALRVTSFPAVVYRNEDVTLTACGKPNTEYKLSVYYSSGASTADGLGKKTSDGNGNISWSWQIGGRTNPGNYRMTISGGGENITYNFTVGDS